MIKRCGYIALIGRPNVGKSTLINNILGVHLAAATPKAQTTRHRILGVRTIEETQFIFIDTPGIHNNHTNLMNRRMNKTAVQAALDADLVLFIVDKLKFTEQDQAILDRLKEMNIPIVLLVNKVDLVKQKERVLEFLSTIPEADVFKTIIPLSATKKRSVDYLLKTIAPFIPEQEFHYSEDELTDRSMRFISSEMVREQLMVSLQDEIPYLIAVDIEKYEDTADLINISACIYVDRKNHKGMVIGKQGDVLKSVGTNARKNIENLAGKKVFLKLWVKHKPNWLDDEAVLKSLDIAE